MRPKKCRRIKCKIEADYFKPRGIPLVELQEMELLFDELEAIRLADFLGLYHEEAAKRMDISRATFGRTLENARKKIAESIITGKAIKISKSEK